MKKTLAIAGLALWMIGSGWYYTCKIKERCYDGSSPGHSETEVNQSGIIADYPLMFDWESEKPMIGTGFVVWRDSLASLIKPGSKLKLSGLFSPEEKNLTSEQDLGLARARLARTLFSGVPDSLILIESRTDGGLLASAGSKLAAVDISVVETVSNEVEEIGSFTINFPSNSAARISDPATDIYLDKLVEVLKNSDKTIEITGHTDNIGTNEINEKMGLMRANAIRSVLISKGVPAAKILTFSKGEELPAFSNDTEEGRSKNRRIEIIVK
ncbi:MAG: OmpA family protein [Lentimicrobium sp.]|nr:OmpA family protein [Lentimicrobium sp.]